MKKLFTLAFSLFAFNSFAQIAAGDMETFHTYTVDGTTLEAPDGWFGSDSAIFALNETLPFLGLTPEKQIFQSTTAHSGNKAVRILTKDIGSFFGVAGGTLSNAKISFTQAGITYDGGAAVTERIPYVDAWVTYVAGAGSDSGSLTVTAIISGGVNGDSIVGVGSVLIGETNNQYMHISAPVIYTDPNVIPEKIQITFNSSGSTTPEDGSALRADDITLATLSVRNITNSNAVKLYPNPSTGMVSVYNTLNEAVTMKVFALNGQQVAEKKFKGNDVIDLTAQANGVYFYTILNGNGQAVQSGKLTVVK